MDNEKKVEEIINLLEELEFIKMDDTGYETWYKNTYYFVRLFIYHPDSFSTSSYYITDSDISLKVEEADEFISILKYMFRFKIREEKIKKIING